MVVVTTTMGAFACGPVLAATFGLVWGLALGYGDTALPTSALESLPCQRCTAGGQPGGSTLFGFGLLDLSLDSRLLAEQPQDIATLIQPPPGICSWLG